MDGLGKRVAEGQATLPLVKQIIGQLDLADLVKVLGFVPRDDLTAFYCNALALVYPTFFGPENLPPLEAMALGCPVIASNVAGAEEQLGDAALLFDPKDESQLARAIYDLCTSIELRERLIE